MMEDVLTAEGDQEIAVTEGVQEEEVTTKDDCLVKEGNKDLFLIHLLILYNTHKGFNPLPHMSISGSSNSAANKDMMSKIWTNGDTIFRLSRKHCGKRRNCLLRAISPFPTMFSKAVCCRCVKMSIYGVKGKQPWEKGF